MLSLKFKDFMHGNYNDEEFHKIYIVRNGSEVLYVGISRNNIYNRWFSKFSGRMYRIDGKWVGCDSIGREIAEHIPDSLEYSIDLYTQAEMISICIDEIALIYGSADEFSLDYNLEAVERFAIDKFRPALNVVGNKWQRDTNSKEHSIACTKVINAVFGQLNST